MKLLITLCVLLTVVAADKECFNPGNNQHQRVELLNRTDYPAMSGDVIEYYCEEGFKLLGNKNRFCQPRGLWFPPMMPLCGFHLTYPQFLAPSTGISSQKNIFDGDFKKCSEVDLSTDPDITFVEYNIDLLLPHHIHLFRFYFDSAMSVAPEVTIKFSNTSNYGYDDNEEFQILSTANPDSTELGYDGYVYDFFTRTHTTSEFLKVKIGLRKELSPIFKLCELELYATTAVSSKYCELHPFNKDATFSLQNKCYSFTNEMVSDFELAKSTCASYGAVLPVIDGGGVQKFMRHKAYETYTTSKSTIDAIWLGAQYISGNWLWQDGTEVSSEVKKLIRNKESEGNCLILDGKPGSGDWLIFRKECSKLVNYTTGMVCMYNRTSCGRPPVPESAVLNLEHYDTPIGSTGSYSCIEGMNGTVTNITCGEFGLWYGKDPECEKIWDNQVKPPGPVVYREGLSAGILAGIIIGIIAVVVVLVIVGIVLKKKSRRRREARNDPEGHMAQKYQVKGRTPKTQKQERTPEVEPLNRDEVDKERRNKVKFDEK